MKTLQLKKQAYHEAGHAVAAIVLGRQVERVSVDRVGSTLLVPAAATLFDQVTVLMAGLQGERAWYTGNFKRAPTLLSMRFGRSAHDYASAQELGADASLIGCCETAAREIIKANWLAVDALAGALMKRGALSGAEALNFFTPKPRLYVESRHA